jgi:hypothetical protein
MIRNSVQRLSEEIMLKQRTKAPEIIAPARYLASSIATRMPR